MKEVKDMTFTKRRDTYTSKDGMFTIHLDNGRIKGLYPKYYVTHKTACGLRHASTLKEAKEVASQLARFDEFFRVGVTLGL